MVRRTFLLDNDGVDVVVECCNGNVGGNVHGANAEEDIWVIEGDLLRHLHHDQDDGKVGSITKLLACFLQLSQPLKAHPQMRTRAPCYLVKIEGPRSSYIWGLNIEKAMVNRDATKDGRRQDKTESKTTDSKTTVLRSQGCEIYPASSLLNEKKGC